MVPKLYTRTRTDPIQFSFLLFLRKIDFKNLIIETLNYEEGKYSIKI